MHIDSHILELLVYLLPVEVVNLVDYDLGMGLILIEIQHIHTVLISDVPCVNTHGLSVLLGRLLATVEHVSWSVKEVLGVARIGHLQMGTLITVLDACHAV